MKERIIITVEMEDGDHDARASMRVPYDCRTIIFGPWLDQAIRDLRSDCESLLKIKREQRCCSRCGEKIPLTLVSPSGLCGLCEDDERNR